MLQTFITGFFLSMSLIVAIGAQNAFILKQGLKREHVFAVCLVCAVSDALLISLGIGGFAQVLLSYPTLTQFAKYAGACFLLVYGASSFYSSFTASQSLQAKGEETPSLMSTIAVCLAFTWLNPHVYLDTVVLLGTISLKYQEHSFAFGCGALTASFIFFFSLGYGARLLLPIFQQAKAWKILDFIIGCVMWLIAFSLMT